MEDSWKVRMNICTALWSFVNFCPLSQSEVSTDNRKVSTFFAFQHVRCRCCYRSYLDRFLKRDQNYLGFSQEFFSLGHSFETLINNVRENMSFRGLFKKYWQDYLRDKNQISGMRCISAHSVIYLSYSVRVLTAIFCQWSQITL